VLGRALAFAAGTALALATTPALADKEPAKSDCVRAYEAAQKDRLAGDLPAAKAGLLVCSNAACPAIVQSDCAGWLREVEAAMPSLVVTIRDPGGADVVGAKVYVDGDRAHPHAIGEAFDVKPGPRKLEVEAPNAPPITREVVVSPAEKNRVIPLVIGAAASTAPPPPPAAPFPRGAIALGVIGGVIAAGGIGVDVAGTVRLHDLRTGCAPGCSPDRIDATRAEIITGDVILATGVVVLGAAVVYYFTQRRSAPRDAMSPAPFSVRF
jgi:hypothetical protein